MLRFCVCIIFQVVCLSKGRGLEWTPFKMKIIPPSCSEFYKKKKLCYIDNTWTWGIIGEVVSVPDSRPQGPGFKTNTNICSTLSLFTQGYGINM